MTMQKSLARLLDITEPCRFDMHEPDNQGVSAVVTGTHLDNAMGDDPYRNFCEFTVGITQDERTEWFNLATLIALARMARIGGDK